MEDLDRKKTSGPTPMKAAVHFKQHVSILTGNNTIPTQELETTLQLKTIRVMHDRLICLYLR